MKVNQKMTDHKAPAVAERQAAPASVTLLTPQQLAERLAVPPSWVREKTRERARVRDKDPLPVVRLGKYVRFSWAAVEAWLGRQGT
jgi:excisionase family DNA binding protein